MRHCRNAKAFQADVTSRESLAALMRDVHNDMGRVNLLCANAGVASAPGGVLGRTDEEWDFVFRVNLMGAVKTVEAVIDDLRANRPDSRLLFTASIAGLMVRGHIPLGIYSVSKFAAVGLGEELKRQFDEEGIGMGMLLPGAVPSAMPQYSRALSSGEVLPYIDPMQVRMTDEQRSWLVSPADVAQVALDGLRKDIFYISTHADAPERLRRHYAHVVEELAACGVEPGL